MKYRVKLPAPSGIQDARIRWMLGFRRKDPKPGLADKGKGSRAHSVKGGR